MKGVVPVAALLLAAAPPAPAQHAAAEHAHMHEPITLYTQAERLEYRDGPGEDPGVLAWDLQGLYGGDYNRFVWKTEGESADGDTAFELQLLYGRAWTAFFDLQFGIRYAETDGGDVTAAVAGVQGLLPYLVETDVALFLSEDGDVTGRAEFEKDFLLTERWVLQPRAEFDVALQDVPGLGIDSGLTKLALGLRLRYEITRKLAPYVGVDWKRHDSAGGEDTDTYALAGLRFWF